MLPIYDKFFAPSEVLIHKTLYGHIKTYNEKLNLKAKFTDNAYYPCMIFSYAGNQTYDHISEEMIEQVVEKSVSNNKNILILDTIVEDFINVPFIEYLIKLIDKGVPACNIKLITSCNPQEFFREQWLRGEFISDIDCSNYIPEFEKIEIFSYDGFSTSFMIHQSGKNIPPPEIKHRNFDLHYCLLQKNARYFRKIVHAFFIHNKMNKKSIYSWHNEGSDNKWDSHLELACKEYNIETNFELFSTPIIYDDYMTNDEWSMDDEIYNRCAFNIFVETTASRDNPSILYSSSESGKNNFFLTEKTYKNFWYGIPFLHISYPLEKYLESLGYKTFKHLFEYNKIPVTSYHHYLHNDFNLLRVINNMSIDELSSILNSEVALGHLKHNRKLLTRLEPLKGLIAELDKY